MILYVGGGYSHFLQFFRGNVKGRGKAVTCIIRGGTNSSHMPDKKRVGWLTCGRECERVRRCACVRACVRACVCVCVCVCVCDERAHHLDFLAVVEYVLTQEFDKSDVMSYELIGGKREERNNNERENITVAKHKDQPPKQAKPTPQNWKYLVNHVRDGSERVLDDQCVRHRPGHIQGPRRRGR